MSSPVELEESFNLKQGVGFMNPSKLYKTVAHLWRSKWSFLQGSKVAFELVMPVRKDGCGRTS